MVSGQGLSRVLYVDLTRRRYWSEDRREIFEKYMGGAGAAIQLLQEECRKGTDPLGSDNPIVLCVGPLTGLFPLASKTVAMFKSPLTGNLGESHAGGRSAVAIRSAGYGGIVVGGSSPSPIYVVVHGDKVSFKDASGLWGVRSAITVGRVIRDLEPNPGIRTIMRIGKAGERMVSFSSVTTETFRHFGRLGLGAVFGSKKLKALVVSGKKVLPLKEIKFYRETYDEIFNAATRTELMKKYHDLGTPMSVLPLNELGALPTRNLKEARFEAAETLSGESLAKGFLGRRVACAHCPVACIHIAALKEPYEREPYFYKITMISYDYELIYALGSMLGIRDVADLLKLIHEVEIQGMDAISTGVALAWATEATEKGFINEEDIGGVRLSWGDSHSYQRAMTMIVDQPTDFFKDLARGVAFASAKYGGSDFALAFGGNEMPGYHTGPASYAGYLTGARHSHLDGAGYGIDEKSKAGEAFVPSIAAEKLLEEEVWRQILSSLVVCYFARAIYRPSLVLKTLRAVGQELTEDELRNLGLEILKAKNAFKVREGFDPKNLAIPGRIAETPSPKGIISREGVQQTTKAFFEKLNI